MIQGCLSTDLRARRSFAGSAETTEKFANLRPVRAECLTTSSEYDNNGARLWSPVYRTPAVAAIPTRHVRSGFAGSDASGGIPPGEDGMDLEKDNFEEENELSGLEEDDELAGDADVVETEEEELIITDEEPEEAAKPAPKAAPKPAAKPAAKKAAAKPAAKPAKKAPAKKAKKKASKPKPKKKAAKKPAKKKKR